MRGYMGIKAGLRISARAFNRALAAPVRMSSLSPADLGGDIGLLPAFAVDGEEYDYDNLNRLSS